MNEDAMNEDAMNCQDLSSCFVDYVNGDLSADRAAEVRRHLGDCPSCREEVESLGAVWQALGQLAEEEPSEAVRGRFYAMLDAYEEERAARTSRSRTLTGWLAGWWPERPAVQLGVAAAALVLGLAVGVRFAPAPSGGELSELRAEVASLNRLVSLSLLHQPSASNRLQGVSYSRRTAGDDEVIAALVDAMNGDENVGVRLAAVDALARFADRPRVVGEMRASLLAESSPLVQLALVDLLAELDGPETSGLLRELAAKRDIDPAVRQRIAEHLGPRA